jgi:hypothetical protein
VTTKDGHFPLDISLFLERLWGLMKCNFN